MGIKGIGKEGRFYIKFLVAAALLIALASALYTLAANPSASLCTPYQPQNRLEAMPS